MVMPEFLSDLLLAWTPSPRDLMPPPRALLPMPTMDMVLATDITMARGLPMLMPTMPMVILMPMPPLLLLFPSDLPLVLTPSPRDLMPLPKELLPMPTMDTTMARGLLTLMLTTLMVILMPMLLLEFLSDLPLVLTPSPKDWTPPLRAMPHMPITDMVFMELSMVRFRGELRLLLPFYLLELFCYALTQRYSVPFRMSPDIS